MEMDAIYYKEPVELRVWLRANFDKVSEQWIGFYKVGAKEKGITYSQALDEALCFGWIDGLRKRVDEERFKIRFTPRKPRSIWSAVNIKRVGELSDMGLVQPAGLRAFEARAPERSNLYSFEQPDISLGDVFEAEFRRNSGAWDFFQQQAPSYKKTAIWWVISAKREDTKKKRLSTLIDDSAYGRRLAHLTYVAKP